MLGIAMFTIVRSSRVMKNPRETTISTTHGLPRYLLTIPNPSGRRRFADAGGLPKSTSLMLGPGTDIVGERSRRGPAGRERGRRAQYAPAMNLNGVAAIVSGGASGLGEATVRGLAAAGCHVVVADLNEERGKAVADSVGGVFVRTDVADE